MGHVDLESALQLADDLTPPVPRSGVRGQAVSDDVTDMPATELARPRPSLAIGVTGSVGSDRFRIAVRIQDRAFENSARVHAIREAAAGEVDVEYIGPVLAESLMRRGRPLHPGLSIAHVDVTAGTLGAFVDRDGHVHALSNNHVLSASNAGTVGDKVLQPGPADGGAAPGDVIGQLAYTVPLLPTDINYVDAALVAVDESIQAELTIPGVGQVSDTCPVAEAYEVAKLGRTTGLTSGAVFTFNMNNVVVGYPGLGSLRFDRQIEIRGHDGRFSAGGDSGALVVTGEERPRAVGLHFAGTTGSSARSFANPIGAVLERLKCRLAT
jgi:hypothetical protein